MDIQTNAHESTPENPQPLSIEAELVLHENERFLAIPKGMKSPSVTHSQRSLDS